VRWRRGKILMRALTDPLARILISAIFLISGVQMLMHFDSTAHMIGEKGIPLATVSAAISILISIVGAVMIIIGWQTKLAAAIQFVYLIPVTIMYHNFWAAPPQLRDMQQTNFLKNLAIMGGLLILATRGAGASSVDEGSTHP
jgi:putative oxidoreductase